MRSKHFGGKLTDALIAQYARSPQWRDGKFQNLIDTEIDLKLYKIPGLICKQLEVRKTNSPRQPLPVIPFDRSAFLAPAARARMIWYGHSAVLMRIMGQTLLIDPMFGPDTSPVAPFRTRRFSEHTLALIDEFPEIDLVLLTHDHYDHLDLASIQKLKGKVRHYFVALGVKRHLEFWGVAPELVTEFDWWDAREFNQIRITFTPTRHFSGRGLTDRAKSLWGGWAFETPDEKIWFSGDGGYGPHFRTIGEHFGGFDFGLMECGQYNELWHAIHFYPEESIQAGIDARVHRAMPVHWAGFSLAPHPWTEPAERFLKAAQDQHLPVTFPRIGMPFSADDMFPDPWWRE